MNELARGGTVDDALLASLEVEGRRLAEAYRLGRPDATAPGLAWSAREVLAHTGAVHRWAADIVVRALPTNVTGGSRAFAWAGPDEDLVDWFEEGLDQLLAALRAAAVDLRCFTFVPGVAPRRFWIRRQAHETAIHRADVEGSVSTAVGEVEPWFAQDGLGEIVGAFAREPRFAIDGPGRLVLAATDGPSWRIDFGSAGNRIESGTFGTEDAHAVVRGTSDRLYRWAWNRPVDRLDISGDPALVQVWKDTVRIT